MPAPEPSTIRAVVNGESVLVRDGTLLVEFLAERGVESRRLAVERNREVVPRAAHSGIVMRDGDVFEIVHFVGGG